MYVPKALDVIDASRFFRKGWKIEHGHWVISPIHRELDTALRRDFVDHGLAQLTISEKITPFNGKLPECGWQYAFGRLRININAIPINYSGDVTGLEEEGFDDDFINLRNELDEYTFSQAFFRKHESKKTRDFRKQPDISTLYNIVFGYGKKIYDGYESLSLGSSVYEIVTGVESYKQDISTFWGDLTVVAREESEKTRIAIQKSASYIDYNFADLTMLQPSHYARIIKIREYDTPQFTAFMKDLSSCVVSKA